MEHLDDLEHGPTHALAAWPNDAVNDLTNNQG